MQISSPRHSPSQNVAEPILTTKTDPEITEVSEASEVSEEAPTAVFALESSSPPASKSPMQDEVLHAGTSTDQLDTAEIHSSIAREWRVTEVP